MGCVSTDSYESCDVKGLNYLGCNAKEPQCSWIDNNCVCVKLLNINQPCYKIQDYHKCQLRNECYYDADSDLIKITNLGRCKEKTCNLRNNTECESQIVYGYICYLDKQGICQPAHDCTDIKNAVQSCSNYSIQDRPCVEKENLNNIVQCETLKNCKQLDGIACQKNVQYCIYSDNKCSEKQCINYMDENSCPKVKCTWRSSKQRCLEQMSCELYDLANDCNESRYGNKQCGWIKSDNSTSICIAGCRYLPQHFVNCQGTQIRQSVCINLKDICIQCEEITDPCLCLEQEDYCHFDIYKNICQSKSCESFNQVTCLTSRCTFNQEQKICIPQCRFRYNKQECSFSNDCYWDQVQRQCLQYLKDISILEPSPNIQNQAKIMELLIICLLIIF